MTFRIIMSNYTITISGEAYQRVKDVILAADGKQWFPLEVEMGRWIVPAHIIAVEGIIVAGPDPVIATLIKDM